MQIWRGADCAKLYTKDGLCGGGTAAKPVTQTGGFWKWAVPARSSVREKTHELGGVGFCETNPNEDVLKAENRNGRR